MEYLEFLLFRQWNFDLYTIIKTLDIFSHGKNDQVLQLPCAKHQDYNYRVGFTLCIFKQRPKSEDLNSDPYDVDGKTMF